MEGKMMNGYLVLEEPEKVPEGEKEQFTDEDLQELLDYFKEHQPEIEKDDLADWSRFFNTDKE